MKIILLFALASVGVCWESGSLDPQPPEECSTCEPYVPTFDRCDNFVNKHADDDDCLKYALESVPQLLEIAKKLICKHRRNELDKRFQYYAEFEKEMKVFLNCTGCFIGKKLGVEEILEKVGATVGTLSGMSVETITEIIHNTGTLNQVLDLTCDLLTGKLISECVEMLSNSDLKSKTDSMRDISFMAKLDPVDSKIIIKLLNDIGCIEEDLSGVENTWENVPEGVGKTLNSLLKSCLNKVLEVPGVGDLVKDVSYTVLGLVESVLGLSGFLSTFE